MVLMENALQIAWDYLERTGQISDPEFTSRFLSILSNTWCAAGSDVGSGYRTRPSRPTSGSEVWRPDLKRVVNSGSCEFRRRARAFVASQSALPADSDRRTEPANDRQDFTGTLWTSSPSSVLTEKILRAPQSFTSISI